MLPQVAYVTDLEGQWPKLVAFATDNPLVSLVDGQLELASQAVLVFGGDALDRGPAGQRTLQTLLDAKLAYPDRVVLLAGNRDINKLRLLHELAPEPALRVAHRRAPEVLVRGPRGPLLRWILAETMNAGAAFDHRATELADRGQACDDEAVADSMVADVQGNGLLLRYLQQCQLAYLHADTLFVHGAVTPENFGEVPGHLLPAASVVAWIARLNGFLAAGVAAAAEDDPAGYAAIVRYQAPAPGMNHNPHSVVYGRPVDPHGNPLLPAAALVAQLQAQGVHRLVVGHTPIGDCPAVLCTDGFDMIMADNSYSRLERGAQVLLDGSRATIKAWVALDDGELAQVACTYDRSAPNGVGCRNTTTGELVKARMADGRMLLHRGLPDHVVSQTASENLPAGLWSAPYFAVADSGCKTLP